MLALIIFFYVVFMFCPSMLTAQPLGMQASIFGASRGIIEGCGRKGIQRKNTMGCTAGLTLALVRVAAAGLLVVILSEVSERRPAINQGPHQFQN